MERASAPGSSASCNPAISLPVNNLVLEPGGYGFIDLVKIGVPLALLTGVVSLILIPLPFPL